MSYTINEYHGGYNIVKRTGSPAYIVVHYVGAGSSAAGNAKANCVYFSGGNRNASAHYFIDDGGIWEYADPSAYTCWHVGDGKGKYGITNSNSIGIEVCNNGGPYTATEIDELRWLVRKLMADFGIAADHVVRHYDASRKLCPAYYAQNQSAWDELHATITTDPEPAPALPDSLKGFTDLDASAWYVGAVAGAVERGLFGGYGNGLFGPNDALTRGQAVCVIAKAAGAEFEHPYSDVTASPYYYDAVAWAKDAGIVTSANDTFRPDAACTRAELCQMLCNWKKGGNVGEPTGMADWGDVPSWAKAAVAWGVENGVLGSTGRIRPNDACTRAEACQMFVNLLG